VQAGVALDSLDTAPAEARAAMLRVRAVAAGARPELRAALGLLRAEGGTPDMLAQPGLDQLGDLVATTRAAGLRTTLAVAEDLPALPAFTQLTVYRIAQEALTNVVRHARATEAAVSLRAEAGQLRLSVRDDGHGGSGHGESGGLGIAGMRERVHLLGGTLRAAPEPGGGFLLEARIPLEVA
jgi:signal transduction histidine kinase